MTATLSTHKNIRHIYDMILNNRELSWLAFNERVLQEAMDESVPLVERIRFLGIYSNNMDEFYRVRVANLKRMVALNNKKVEGFKGTAEELFSAIHTVVIKQQRKFEETYQDLLKALAKENIHHFDETTVNHETKAALAQLFNTTLVHELVPVLIDKRIPFPRLRDKVIYLAVRMEWDKNSKTRMALIEIPETLDRFHMIEQDGKRGLILIDDIIRLNLDHLFALFRYDSIAAYTFKFTRDAELDFDDDLSLSFIEKMEKSIKNRKKGDPVRLVVDHRMPIDLLEVLNKHLNLSKQTLAIPGGKYHNFKDFMRFPNFGEEHFLYPKLKSAEHPLLKGKPSIIKQILSHDILLHFPYQRFDHVVDLLREAAIDPKVKSIKINVYRVADRSQVMNALINAVRNGKQVIAILELQARFDEEHNLYWTERLKEEGANVIHGYEGLKIHSKLIQIERVSDKKRQLISYIGTGNFNERTAGIYTDLGLLTSDKSLGAEVGQVFNLMEHALHNFTFNELHVSPLNARRKLTSLIQNEIKNAKQGNEAFIDLKINNLVDTKLIHKLYDASNAGVKIRLIVRGVCCLIPKMKNKSENIEAISIVDRFLEHSRFMKFGNGGKPLYFISSADWMERNMDNRIEVGVPVYAQHIQEQIDDIFTLMWSDNIKARIIDKKLSNKYKEQNGEPKRGQILLQEYYNNL
jgi:polyphosphate kinase